MNQTLSVLVIVLLSFLFLVSPDFGLFSGIATIVLEQQSPAVS